MTPLRDFCPHILSPFWKISGSTPVNALHCKILGTPMIMPMTVTTRSPEKAQVDECIIMVSSLEDGSRTSRSWGHILVTSTPRDIISAPFINNDVRKQQRKCYDHSVFVNRPICLWYDYNPRRHVEGVLNVTKEWVSMRKSDIGPIASIREGTYRPVLSLVADCISVSRLA